METRHTPGPWRINGSLITSQAAMALQVAIVYPPKVGNAPRDIDERDANARLIAAAPDLLDALRLLLDGLQTYAPEFMHGLPKADYIRAARAAIAKAEG